MSASSMTDWLADWVINAPPLTDGRFWLGAALGPVHSGLSPSCMDDWTHQQALGARVGFTEALVDCASCKALWAERGVPSHIVRLAE